MLRAVMVIIMAAAAAGVFISADLTFIHYRTFTDSSYQSYCAMSDAWNCQTVAMSEYSVFWKLPVALWGFLVYLLYVFVAIVAFVDFRKGRNKGIRGLGALFVMGALGLCVSALLLYISHAYIQSKCVLCTGLYILNTIIFLSIAILAVCRKDNPFRWIKVDIKGILLSPGYPISGFIVSGILAVVLVAYYPRLYIEDVNCACSDEGLEAGAPSCNQEATYGSSKATLVITEFSDYECPFCGMLHFNLRKAVDKFSGRVMLKHKHFPLDIACNPLLRGPFHHHACLAAMAAVCGGKQNRFWDLNDLLYKEQRQLSKNKVLEMAEKLDLDMSKFRTCLKDPATLELVKDDIKEATNSPFVKSGMVGTPIIYIGDSPHIGGMSYGEIVQIINEKLAEKKK